MEVEGGTGNKFFVFLFELLGTAMLLIAINWASTSGAVAEAVGLTVMMCAQIMGPISGGHFNPAVTIGMLWKEGKEHFGGKDKAVALDPDPLLIAQHRAQFAEEFRPIAFEVLCLVGQLGPLGLQTRFSSATRRASWARSICFTSETSPQR